MPALTIKNIAAPLYERLKKSTNAHRRSINSEAIVRLEQALGSRPVDPESFLARADALHKQLALPKRTERTLRRAKARGRP